jgi:hypothetical protein
MSFAGILSKIDDRLNPIVVKELRQAVQGRFVTVVLLLFLFIQVLVLGAFLFLSEIGSPGDLEAEHGRTVFSVLQGILLVTCILFLPLYTGARLGAERSDTNVDLLFITTLRPRAIISGKLSAALVLALLIFSACAPFMAFTYLLRGLDLFSILLVLGIDFFIVVLAIQLALFFGSIPGHWLLKLGVGLLGLIALLVLCYFTLLATVTLLSEGSRRGYVDSAEFWLVVSGGAALGLMQMALLFTWAVAMVSPPSANRALPSRLLMLVGLLGTGAVFGAWNVLWRGDFRDCMPLFFWVIFMSELWGLQLIIAINEREAWGPRVARTIPRRWWLRLPTFLVYSGSASGMLFSLLLFGLTWLLALGILALTPPAGPLPPGFGGFHPITPRDILPDVFRVCAILLLYLYGYALTAVLLCRLAGPRIRKVDTWVVLIFLLAISCAVPLVLSYVFSSSVAGHRWSYNEQYYWLLNNPIAGAIAAGNRFDPHRGLFFAVAGGWAGLATLLNLPWFVGQLRRFRPFSGSTLPIAVAAPVLLTTADMDATKTAP